MFRRSALPALIILAAVVAAQARLLAWDDINAPSGTAMNGVNTGSGWADPWEWHNETGDPLEYAVASASPLSYLGLTTSGNYITVNTPDRLGRMLDVGGAFSAYTNDGNQIGKPGTTLWMSLLYRKNDTDPAKSMWFSTHGAPGPADNDDGAMWAVGVFMEYRNNASQSGNTVYWTLGSGLCGINHDCTVYQRTSKPVVANQAVLCVVKFEFESGSANVSLYVNPSSLGGAAPPSADAQVTVSSDLTFRALAFEGSGRSSMDEIRFGESFADVTPASGVSTVVRPPVAAVGALTVASGADGLVVGLGDSRAQRLAVYQPNGSLMYCRTVVGPRVMVPCDAWSHGTYLIKTSAGTVPVMR